MKKDILYPLRVLYGTVKHKVLRIPVPKKSATLSITDLFLISSKDGELLRYDMIVRLLAVENYYGKNDCGFELYRKMQYERNKHKGEDFAEKAIERFKALIKSYDEKGYDENSAILLDKNLRLIDGSHRLAMAMYHGYETINAVFEDREVNFSYGIDWFEANGFTADEIKILRDKEAEMRQKLVTPFSCIIWSPAASLADDIVKDLAKYGEICGCTHHSFDEAAYKNMVRAVYAVDSIAKWKIEKKLEYMAGYPTDFVTVKLNITDPVYRAKGNGLPVSTIVEGIKSELRTKYQVHIENYFKDIILHIADNMYQSVYMHRIFDFKFDMRRIINIISRYEYAFLKLDTPHTPKDFPDSVALGKDADILCRREDFEAVRSEIIGYCSSIEGFSTKIIDSYRNCRIRVVYHDVLAFQLDFGWIIPEMADGFTDSALSARIAKDGYYVLDNEHEYLIRMAAYSKKKTKTYHRDYLAAHRDHYNKSLADRFCPCDIDKLLAEETRQPQMQ